MNRFVVALGLALLAAPAHAADPAPTASAPNLNALQSWVVGTWQNQADPGFTRQFNIDGTTVVRVEDDPTATTTGKWQLFAGSAQPFDLAYRKLPAEGFYLRLSEHGDIYLFALTALNPQSLEMLNIDRNLKLTFLRLK